MANIKAAVIMYQWRQVSPEQGEGDPDDPRNKPWAKDVVLHFLLKDEKTDQVAECIWTNGIRREVCLNAKRPCVVRPVIREVITGLVFKQATVQGDPILNDFDSVRCELQQPHGKKELQLRGTLSSRNAGDFYLMMPVLYKDLALVAWPEHHSQERFGQIDVIGIK